MFINNNRTTLRRAAAAILLVAMLVAGCDRSGRELQVPAGRFCAEELMEPYDKVAPDPSQWPSVVAKFKRAVVNFRDGAPKT